MKINRIENALRYVIQFVYWNITSHLWSFIHELRFKFIDSYW